MFMTDCYAAVTYVIYDPSSLIPNYEVDVGSPFNGLSNRA